MREIVRWIAALLGSALVAYLGASRAGFDEGGLRFLGNLLRGNVGGETTAAAPLALEFIRSAALLAFAAFASTAFGILLGTWWARFGRSPWRPLFWVVSLVLRAVPALAVGALLFWALAIRDRVAFPNLLEPTFSQWSWPWALLITAATIIPAWTGIVANRAREALDEHRGGDRATFLRSLGLPESSVFFQSAFPFAAYAALRELPRQLPWQFGALCFVEFVLRMGGFGGHILRAFFEGDIPFVAAALVYTTAALCACGSLFEIVRSRIGASFLDPGGLTPWANTIAAGSGGGRPQWVLTTIALGAGIAAIAIAPAVAIKLSPALGSWLGAEASTVTAPAYSSVFVSLAAVALGAVFGTAFGILGSRVRKLTGRTASESLWVFLTPPAMLVLATLAPRSTGGFVFVAGLLLGAAIARPIALALRGLATAPFLRPAAGSGAPPLRARLRHAAPFALPVIAAATAAQVPAAILLESAAGFLGLAGTGGEAARGSIGAMLRLGHANAFDGNTSAIPATCFLALCLLSAYLLSDFCARALRHRSSKSTTDNTLPHG